MPTGLPDLHARGRARRAATRRRVPPPRHPAFARAERTRLARRHHEVRHLLGYGGAAHGRSRAPRCARRCKGQRCLAPFTVSSLATHDERTRSPRSRVKSYPPRNFTPPPSNPGFSGRWTAGDGSPRVDTRNRKSRRCDHQLFTVDDARGGEAPRSPARTIGQHDGQESSRAPTHSWFRLRPTRL